MVWGRGTGQQITVSWSEGEALDYTSLCRGLRARHWTTHHWVVVWGRGTGQQITVSWSEGEALDYTSLCHGLRARHWTTHHCVVVWGRGTGLHITVSWSEGEALDSTVSWSKGKAWISLWLLWLILSMSFDLGIGGNVIKATNGDAHLIMIVIYQLTLLYWGAVVWYGDPNHQIVTSNMHDPQKPNESFLTSKCNEYCQVSDKCSKSSWFLYSRYHNCYSSFTQSAPA